MEKLAFWQKLLLILMLVLGGIWLFLAVTGHVLAYQNGGSQLATLLKDIAVFFGIGAGGILIVMLTLSRVSEGARKLGQLPGYEGTSVAGWNGFKNLALWIVVAVLLVVLFNIFGSPSSATSQPANLDLTTTLLINALPFLLMIGVWVFFMRQIQKNNKDKDKP